MSFLNRLSISDADKRKIEEMGTSSEDELVSTIRAAEDVARNHLGSSVVDEILSVFASSDKGKTDELPGKFGLILNELPESKL